MTFKCTRCGGELRSSMHKDGLEIIKYVCTTCRGIPVRRVNTIVKLEAKVLFRFKKN